MDSYINVVERTSICTCCVIEQELYWADETLERLEKINVDGSGREMIQAAEAAYSLAADNNYIYIAKAQ
jgi:hypothetical protein